MTEKLAYWRKFNALHVWFVHNCAKGIDDCKDVYVDKKQAELLSICKSVAKDHSQAEKLLLTQFDFFGSTDYDENYFLNVEETIEKLEQLMKDPTTQSAIFKAS